MTEKMLMTYFGFVIIYLFTLCSLIAAQYLKNLYIELKNKQFSQQYKIYKEKTDELIKQNALFRKIINHQEQELNK